MNIIKPIPTDPNWTPRVKKLVYVEELDALIQEDLLPEILRLAAEEEKQEAES